FLVFVGSQLLPDTAGSKNISYVLTIGGQKGTVAFNVDDKGNRTFAAADGTEIAFGTFKLTVGNNQRTLTSETALGRGEYVIPGQKDSTKTTVEIFGLNSDGTLIGRAIGRAGLVYQMPDGTTDPTAKKLNLPKALISENLLIDSDAKTITVGAGAFLVFVGSQLLPD